jgi:DNA-binding LacI/PurR family transcriptional regulator
MRKVTLEDMAVQLGVARSTVSRALRDDPQIAVGTRERVRRLADQLGYHPNAAARALTHRSAGIIGLMLPRSSAFVFANPYFSELLKGVAEVAESAGYPLLLSTDPRPDFERWLGEGRVDGLILLGSSVQEEDLPRLAAMIEAGMPVVFLHAPPRQLSAVTIGSNERAGIWQALSYLKQTGHRRVAYLAGPRDSSYARRRERAYRTGVETFGLEAAETLRRYGDDTLDSGRRLCRHLLDDGVAFDAVLANNDLVAIGACQALEAAGIAVPDRVSVIGFDDTPVAALYRPALSTIRQPILELGERAMEALLALIDGERPESMRLATRLVVRQSTRPLERSDLHG